MMCDVATWQAIGMWIVTPLSLAAVFVVLAWSAR